MANMAATDPVAPFQSWCWTSRHFTSPLQIYVTFFSYSYVFAIEECERPFFWHDSAVVFEYQPCGLTGFPLTDASQLQKWSNDDWSGTARGEYKQESISRDSSLHIATVTHHDSRILNTNKTRAFPAFSSGPLLLLYSVKHEPCSSHAYSYHSLQLISLWRRLQS